LSLAMAATGCGVVNVGPNLATPSDPPIAPKLAAIATHAASRAKRVALRGGGAMVSAFGSGRLNVMTALIGSASWPAGGSVGASTFGSIFFGSIAASVLASTGVSGFAVSVASILGAAGVAASGFAASGAIDGESMAVRVGSILGVSSLDMACGPNGEKFTHW